MVEIRIIDIRDYQTCRERIMVENELEYPDEIWKHVEIDNEKYFVSSMGRCYNEHLKLKTFGGQKGMYLMFQNHRVHRLVAKAFIPTERDISIHDVNHKNGRTYDNRPSNLEWDTGSENALHAIQLGTRAINAANSNTNPKGTPIRIQQVDKNQNLINIFPSIADASRQSGISEKRIRKSLAEFENTGVLSFIDDNSYAWKPDPLPLQNFTDKLEYKTRNIETRLDLSKYVNNKNIRIGEHDFKQLQENPDACEAIMRILERFDKPILPIINHRKRTSDWSHLFRKNSQIECDSIVANQRGIHLLNHFMLSVMIKGHHPHKPNYIDCWNNLEIRRKLVQRMLKYNSSMNNSSLMGCHGIKYGRPYNFPPNVAKALYNHVNARRVLDFCAGYGGRLVGFWASKAEEYIGIDPNKEIPYAGLIDFLQSETSVSKKFQIIQDRAEAVDYEKLGKFDTIFTSPPYFNTEIYSDDPSQSCHMYPQIKDWLEKFLFSTLRNVINVLLPGGTLMINIKDSKKIAIVEPMLEFLRKDNRLTEGNHIKFIQPKRFKNNKQEYIYVWHFPKPKIVFAES